MGLGTVLGEREGVMCSSSSGEIHCGEERKSDQVLSDLERRGYFLEDSQLVNLPVLFHAACDHPFPVGKGRGWTSLEL